MDAGINWGKLVKQGRAKAPGIPWTEEELNAIHKNGMSVEDVRAGILEPTKAPKKASKGKEKPVSVEESLELISMPELVKKAQELKIVFDPNVVSRGDLILEIKKKLKALLESKTR